MKLTRKNKNRILSPIILLAQSRLRKLQCRKYANFHKKGRHGSKDRTKSPVEKLRVMKNKFWAGVGLCLSQGT